MSLFQRQFSMKCFFEDIDSMEQNTPYKGKEEIHFGITWELYAKKTGEQVFVGVHPKSDEAGAQFRIKATCRVFYALQTRVLKKVEFHTLRFRHGSPIQFMEIANFGYSYHDDRKVDGGIDAKIVVDILELSGLPKKRLQDFETEDDDTDLVIVIGDRQFKISSVILRTQTTYFKAHTELTKLLSGKPRGNKKAKMDGLPTFELNDPNNPVNPEVFQAILELLHNEDALTDDNVLDVLELSHFWHIPRILKKCEEYLIVAAGNISRKSKFELCIRFDCFDELKKHLIENCRKRDDLAMILPRDINTLSSEDKTLVLQRFLEIP